ncbi:hypothetical protein C8F01DRAFT_1374423 [Mycena amicta]|nr:hypothetical protein C8F01DRAFT_1374423 [Mycena amicta]
MHQLLRLKNLANLPMDVKAFALAACSPNGTSEDIDHVFMHAKQHLDDMTYLPVFFQLLQPAHIPREGEFYPESIGRQNTVLIPGALAAIQALSSCDFPGEAEGAISEIWSRVMPWIIFLSDYVSCLPTSDANAEGHLAVDFLILSFFLSKDEGVSARMSRNPDSRILAKAWSLIDTLPKSMQLDAAHNFSTTVRFIHHGKDSPALIEALLDGLDGGMYRLAKLVVFALDSNLTEVETNEKSDAAVMISLSSILDFTINIDPVFKNPNALGRRFNAFGLTLLKDGIVPILCDILFALSSRVARCPNDGSDFIKATISDSLFSLSIIFGLSPGNLLLPDALEHRFLDSLIHVAIGPYASSFCPGAGIKQTFELILPAMLIRHSCLGPFREAVARVARMTSSPAFKSTEIFPAWGNFIKLLEEYLIVFDAFNAESSIIALLEILMKHLVKCNLVNKRHKFKMCSGCRTFFYCSNACQTMDWCEGGHRDACESHYAMHIQMRNMDLSSRDRGLIRAKMDYDSQTNAKKLLPAIAYLELAAARSPASENALVLITVCDVTKGEAKYWYLDPKSDDYERFLRRSVIPIARAAYNDLVRRAIETDGRVFVDVVRFYPGRIHEKETQLWIVPGYSTRPLIHDFPAPSFPPAEGELGDLTHLSLMKGRSFWSGCAGFITSGVRRRT